jgi:hypothetical protein
MEREEGREARILDLNNVRSKEELLLIYRPSEEAKEEEKRQKAIRTAEDIIDYSIFAKYGGTIVYGCSKIWTSETLKDQLGKMKVPELQFEVSQLEKLLLQCRQFPAKVKDAVDQESRFHHPTEWNRENEEKLWQPKLESVADAIPFIEQTIQAYQHRLGELKPLVDAQQQFLETMQTATAEANDHIAEIQKLFKKTWRNKPEKNIQKIVDLLYAWYQQSLLFQKTKEQYVYGGGLLGNIPEFPKNPLDSFLFDSPFRAEIERKYMGLIAYHGGE